MRLYTAANLAVAGVAHKGTPHNRYSALNGVHFQPDGGTVATNGHAVLMVSAPTHEQAADFPHLEANANPPALAGFTIPAESATAILKAIPKRDSRPVLMHAALDETRTAANGSAFFVTTDLASRREHEVKKLDGSFPPAPYCIPQRAESTFRMGFDLDNLIPFLQAVKAAIGGKGGYHDNVVELSFGLPKNAVRLDARNEDTGQTVTGAIMPADAGGCYRE